MNTSGAFNDDDKCLKVIKIIIYHHHGHHVLFEIHKLQDNLNVVFEN